LTAFTPFSLYLLIFLCYLMVAKEIDGSMQWFHFFDGIFLGQWYPEWFLAKSMVLERFTP